MLHLLSIVKLQREQNLNIPNVSSFLILRIKKGRPQPRTDQFITTQPYLGPTHFRGIINWMSFSLAISFFRCVIKSYWFVLLVCLFICFVDTKIRRYHRGKLPNSSSFRLFLVIASLMNMPLFTRTYMMKISINIFRFISGSIALLFDYTHY